MTDKMTNQQLIQRIRVKGLELRELRLSMTAMQRNTGAGLELDQAVLKIADALRALGAG